MSDNDWMGLWGKASWKIVAWSETATRKHWQRNQDQGFLDFLKQELYFIDNKL